MARYIRSTRLRKTEEVGVLSLDRRGRWIGAGLLALLGGAALGIALDEDWLVAACMLGLLGGTPWFLARGREEREAAARQRLAPDKSLAAPAAPVSAFRRILKMYFATAFGVFVLGVFFANKFIMPVHVPMASASSPDPFARWTWQPLLAAILLFLVAYLVAYVHAWTARALAWLSGICFSSSFLALGASLCLSALNVHADTSPVRKAKTSVLSIEPVKSARRDLAPYLVLAEWRDPAGPPVHTRYRSSAFRLDMDGKYATFYWREGFLGRPYAVQWREAP